MRVLELLRRYLGRYRGKAVAGVLTKAVEVVFELLTPLVVARMIDEGVARRDAREVLSLGLLLLVFAAVSYCFTLVCQKCAAMVSQGIGTDVRNDLYRRINSFASPEVDRFGTPSLVTRVTNDTTQVQVAVAMGIRQRVSWPILAVGSVVAALLIDVRLGLVFLVCMPLMALAFWQIMRRSLPYYRSMQSKLDRISLVTREALSGARVIRAFRQEGREDARFAEAADDQADTAVAVGGLSALLNPVTLLVMDLGVVAILWAGGGRVEAGALTQGQVLAFVNYMTTTLTAVTYLANLVVIFMRGSASSQRILEVLDCKPSIADEGNAPVELPDALDASVAAVELRDVSFAYDGAQAPALSHVSLALPQGATLGVIGGTGSGKSTLVSLLPRLYDASHGSVEVLGHDVRAWPLAQLRHEVAVVPQQASLVSGTVRTNLLWRNEGAKDDELWEALEVAQAADFVRARPEGLDAVVEAGGKNLSGGQRQRLTIARALVGCPRVVVLDDAASALDFATDAALRHALRGIGPGLSCVVVSQRVSAVMGCDEVLVLDHGRVAGLGTHDELVRACPVYREICHSQLRGDEVRARA